MKSKMATVRSLFLSANISTTVNKTWAKLCPPGTSAVRDDGNFAEHSGFIVGADVRALMHLATHTCTICCETHSNKTVYVTDQNSN